ncbi:MAG: hypothetical protein F4Z14_09725 [Gammaproteobacteria bacterium]|nr:hypothetical protein [Gammaproteobacteria bacterium]
MKTLRKLLAGSLLVALTVFGLTALTSSSTDSGETTQVWGFLNETCNSEIAVLLDSIEDMLKLRGQEREGIIMDFKSYYRVAELHQADPPCRLVAGLLAEPPVRSIGTPPPVIWIPVETQPNPRPGQPGGGGAVIKNPPPPKEFTFTNKDLKELNECWHQKIKDLFEAAENEDNERKRKQKLKKLRKQLSGYEANAGDRDKYKWIASQEENPFGFGHIDWPPISTVKIFSKNLTKHKFAQPMHIAAQAAFQEYYHIIQRNRLGRDPKPYELYDLEVEAHNTTRGWFRPIFGFGAPIAEFIGDEADFSSDDEFKKKKKEYQDLETDLAKEGLTEAEKKKIKDEMTELEKWFRNPAHLPSTEHVGGGYEKNSDLGCD